MGNKTVTNLEAAWAKATKPSVDEFRRLNTRAHVQPGACVWIALVIFAIRSGGG